MLENIIASVIGAATFAGICYMVRKINDFLHKEK